MDAVVQHADHPPQSPRPRRFAWLTPCVCQLILAAVLTLGFISHLRYLTHNCPIDLSGDEAHYWDWSRQLDLSYYSKGPLVAYIIRGSCALFGDNMPAVRLPALLLGIGTSLATYWLTRRLFDSDRIALGAVLLNHVVPMFVAGSVMMTIDPPFFFCWALATCLAAKAILDRRGWAWVALGLVIGVGFLAKYTMFLWLVGLLLFLLIDQPSRPILRQIYPWLASAIALPFTIPVILWNQRHGWVSFRHVAKQTGTSHGQLSIANVLEFVGSQLGALGPGLAVIIVGAIVYTLGRRSATDKHRRGMYLLVCMGAPFWLIVGTASFRTKVQGNWPAPAYFSLMILAAYFLATRLQSPQTWRPWRVWFWSTILLGVITTPILHNLELLYRPLLRLNIQPRQWDPTCKLRGWSDLAGHIQQQRKLLGDGSIVLCEKYDFAAEMAFYLPDQPKTYCIGTWWTDPQRRPRHSQYDIWPDRRLDQTRLLGKDAVFLGYGQDEDHPKEPPADLAAAFEKVVRAEPFTVVRRGVEIREFHLWRCYGFKGMRPPIGDGEY